MVLELRDFVTAFKRTNLKHFLERVSAFEELLSSASSGDWLSIREFLRFERKYAHLPSGFLNTRESLVGAIDSLSVKNRHTAVNLLLTYRIMDLAADLEGHPELPLQHRRLGSFGDGLKGFSQLSNWPRLLFNLKSSSFMTDQELVTGVENSGPMASNDGRLKLLGRLLGVKKQATVFINLQLAVIALHRMMTTNCSLLEGGPMKKLLNENCLSADEHHHLDDLFKKNDKLDLPLHFATFISPLYLLVPTSLYNSRNDYVRIMLTGKSLGNKRPALLAEVEKDLMSCLFRLATEELDLVSEIKSFIGRIPWDGLRELEGGPDSFWFKPDGDVGNVSFSTADAEGEIPLGWAVTKVPCTQDLAMLPRDDSALRETSLAPFNNVGLAERIQEESPVPDNTPVAEQQRPVQRDDLEEDEVRAVDESDATACFKDGGQQEDGDGVDGEQDDMNVDSNEADADVMDIDLNDDPDGMERDDSLEPEPTRYGLRSRTDMALQAKRKRCPSPERLPDKRMRRKSLKSTTPSSTKPGSSINNPIDLDELFKEDLATDLSLIGAPEKHVGRQIRGYGPTGAVFEFAPALHNKDDLGRLQAFDEAIKAGFINGMPAHVADPENSVFSVMTEAEFERRSVFEIQTMMKQKHILVTDMHAPTLEFNSKGLTSLTTLSTVVDIQDQSICLNAQTMNYNDRRRRGPLRSLLESSRTNGKVLNALNFPMPEQALGSFPFSTDSAAWNGTKGSSDCGGDKVPPLGDIRWGIAATAGALHWWHLDSNRFGTYIDTKAGLKWWVVAKRKGFDHGFESFGEIDLFLNGRYEIEEPNLGLWDVEAVILSPGTRLIMRPNTPHAVFSPQDAICHGGHHYGASTMQDTMFGIVHTFMGDALLTNTEHPTSCSLLRRMAFFYHDVLVLERLDKDEYDLGHIPPLNDFNSVLDLFTLCNLVILMNVLDTRTYVPSEEDFGLRSSVALDKYDLNGIPIMERYQIAYARGRCFGILRWFFSEYELYVVESGLVVEDGFTHVAMGYLAWQVSAILEYKRRALKHGLDAGSNCTVRSLERQVKLCLEGCPSVLEAISLGKSGVEGVSLASPDMHKYGVRKFEEPLFISYSDDFLQDGATAADRKLFHFLKMYGQDD